MAKKTVSVSRMRHYRHRRLKGLDRATAGSRNNPRLRRMRAWLLQQQTRLTSTATGLTYTATVGALATGVLTFAANAVAGETVLINGRVYTWVTALTAATNDQVVVGASTAVSTVNLTDAINGNPLTRGALFSTYTVANADVTAVSGATTVTLSAKSKGVAGNAITTTETMTQGSFAAGTLASGADQFLTSATHGMSDDEGPYVLTTSGTIPAGLAALRQYWIVARDTNTFNLRYQPARWATPGSVGIVNITSAGAITNTITKAVTVRGIASLTRRNKPRRVQAVADIDLLA